MIPPDMLSYTVYLGAFQNSSTHSGPNAMSFQGCPGTIYQALQLASASAMQHLGISAFWLELQRP